MNYILGSDGNFFSYSLEHSDEILFPGEIFAVVQHISTKYSVYILSLDENYMAMFGANCNEEGAMLIIYNTQFKVTQSKQYFKLFTHGAKLWNCENNIFLPVGQNLAVIPFYLETEQLAALIGSHEAVQSEMDTDVAVVQEIEVASWDHTLKLKDLHLPKHLRCKVNDLLKQGLSESVTINELLLLKSENVDVDYLASCIDNFYDISEKYLARLLKYLITLDRKVFCNQSKHSSKLFPSNLQPISRTELIDKILCKPFSEILLLPYLCSELNLQEVVLLLNYICFLWSDEGHLLPVKNLVKSHAKLIEWSFVLIDANFQKLLLSKDKSIQDILNQLNELVEHHLNSFKDLKFLSSVLYYCKRKNLCNDIGTSNIKYSIEQICLYC